MSKGPARSQADEEPPKVHWLALMEEERERGKQAPTPIPVSMRTKESVVLNRTKPPNTLPIAFNEDKPLS